MEPITLRVPEQLAAELSEEADEHGYRSRSEYVRRILRNRSDHAAYSERTQTDYVTRGEFEALEARVDALERGGGESAPDPGSGGVSSPPEPRGMGAEDLPARMVSWAREHQPVSRSEIMAWADPQVEIKAKSWWERHGREALQESGAEFVRNRGWTFEE